MLLIGSAEKTLSPPPGLHMAGYMDRTQPSCGMHDELFVRTVCFSDPAANLNLFLITYDLLGFAVDWQARVTAQVREALQLPGVQVALAASHTHAAPDVMKDAPAEQQFAGVVLQRTVDACRAAYEARAQCLRSEVCTAAVDGVGSVRRLGATVSLPLTLQLFYTDASITAPSLVLAHFPCHPTILSAQNRLYSAEYPGVFVRGLQRLFPEGTTVCFFNGACGDISTRFTRRSQSFDEVERLGNRVVTAAEAALREPRKAASTDVRVQVRTDTVELTPVPPDLELVARLRQHLDATASKSEDALESGGSSDRIRHTQVQALQVLEDHSVLTQEPTMVELVTVSFPGLETYVFWPGEPFSGFADALRADRREETVLVGYAGYIGYLPDVSPQDDPSYEVMMSLYGMAGGQTLLARSEALLK